MKRSRVRYYVISWDEALCAMLAQPCVTKEDARRLWKGTPKTICKVIERTKK